MKSKKIILSLCATAILSLSIFNLSLIGNYGIDPEPTRPSGIIAYGIDPEPTRP
ncbi:hypothetical protein [Brassicibacter mesophilus]|uniref:hypothetical protein n=1 Tax=Brassicibacter mesophilus TaxID=745119 RepID=UPI003D1C10B3